MGLCSGMQWSRMHHTSEKLFGSQKDVFSLSLVRIFHSFKMCGFGQQTVTSTIIANILYDI